MHFYAGKWFLDKRKSGETVTVYFPEKNTKKEGKYYIANIGDIYVVKQDTSTFGVNSDITIAEFPELEMAKSFIMLIN